MTPRIATSFAEGQDNIAIPEYGHSYHAAAETKDTPRKSRSDSPRKGAGPCEVRLAPDEGAAIFPLAPF
jgi:hypothetical protein